MGRLIRKCLICGCKYGIASDNYHLEGDFYSHGYCGTECMEEAREVTLFYKNGGPLLPGYMDTDRGFLLKGVLYFKMKLVQAYMTINVKTNAVEVYLFNKETKKYEHSCDYDQGEDFNHAAEIAKNWAKLTDLVILYPTKEERMAAQKGAVMSKRVELVKAGKVMVRGKVIIVTKKRSKKG